MNPTRLGRNHAQKQTLTLPSATLSHRMGEGWGEGAFVLRLSTLDLLASVSIRG